MGQSEYDDDAREKNTKKKHTLKNGKLAFVAAVGVDQEIASLMNSIQVYILCLEGRSLIFPHSSRCITIALPDNHCSPPAPSTSLQHRVIFSPLIGPVLYYNGR